MFTETVKIGFIVGVTSAFFIFSFLCYTAYAITKEYDCADFPTQEKSQIVFNGNEEDIYRLDQNNNGIACEYLPKE